MSILATLMSLRRTLIVLSLVVLSSGCSTPYKPYGILGGYTDQPAGPNSYRVKFVGNGFTSPETVQEHWNKRASELCGGKPYKASARPGIEIQRGIIVSRSGAYSNTERFPMMEGTVDCES